MANPVLPPQSSDTSSKLQVLGLPHTSLPFQSSQHFIGVCRSYLGEKTFYPSVPQVLTGSKGTVILYYLEGQHVPLNSTETFHILTCLLEDIAVLALLPALNKVCSPCLDTPAPTHVSDPNASLLREQSFVSSLQPGHFHLASSTLLQEPTPVISTSWDLTGLTLHFPSVPSPNFSPQATPPIPVSAALPAKMNYAAITVSKPQTYAN